MPKLPEAILESIPESSVKRIEQNYTNYIEDLEHALSLAKRGDIRTAMDYTEAAAGYSRQIAFEVTAHRAVEDGRLMGRAEEAIRRSQILSLNVQAVLQGATH